MFFMSVFVERKLKDSWKYIPDSSFQNAYLLAVSGFKLAFIEGEVTSDSLQSIRTAFSGVF